MSEKRAHSSPPLAEHEDASAALRFPIDWWPLIFRVSGRYERIRSLVYPTPKIPLPVDGFGADIPTPENGPEPTTGPSAGEGADRFDLGWPFEPIPQPLRTKNSQLRLDVDGHYPQMKVSGTNYMGYWWSVHWIADLQVAGTNQWTGEIFYKNGNNWMLPHTHVAVRAYPSFISSLRRVVVTFYGGGAASKTIWYGHKSQYFHEVEFEFDTVEGQTAVTKIDTCDHPNRPADLECETLSIETVYRRAGFNVRKTGDDGIVLLSDANSNELWSDMEMHDAMQTYWSRFANKAQWSMWVLFANKHEDTIWYDGDDLGGIMFDDIGPNHRQGTAMFNESFIADPPAGDPDPVAWVKRMKFWTAVHEMGHAFNLAHSWDKEAGTPWISTQVDEPEARSFMNYPYYVNGGEQAFFADFEFRFSDQELLFMRHAPERFVQMGNADWFENHGFQNAAVSVRPNLRLELRANRPKTLFEFLEPVTLELKLTNASTRPQLVDSIAMKNGQALTVVIKKQGRTARQWIPFARYCARGEVVALNQGESIYESLPISSGLNGWDLAEPGVYGIQVALHLENDVIVSNLLRVQVAPPRGYDEELLAQDFFSTDVGRVLTFGGSYFLEGANATLREVSDRLADSRVALHCQVALAGPLARRYKLLELEPERPTLTAAAQVGGCFRVRDAKVDEARFALKAALIDGAMARTAAESLGHVLYKRRVDGFTDWLLAEDDGDTAAQCQSAMHDVLAERGVKESVLKSIRGRAENYAKGEVKSERSSRRKKVTTT